MPKRKAELAAEPEAELEGHASKTQIMDDYLDEYGRLPPAIDPSGLETLADSSKQRTMTGNTKSTT